MLRFNFVLTISAMYRVDTNVLDGGFMTTEVIRGSGFVLRVKPRVIDASGCLSTGDGLSIVTAGILSSFRIRSRDAFSNDKTESSGSSWTSSISLISRAPQDSTSLSVGDITASYLDNLDGSFTISYSTTRAGWYNLTASSSTGPYVTLNGTPSRAAPASTVVSGAGISVVSVDGIASFIIHSYDAFGNARTQGHESFAVMAQGGWTRAIDSRFPSSGARLRRMFTQLLRPSSTVIR